MLISQVLFFFSLHIEIPLTCVYIQRKVEIPKEALKLALVSLIPTKQYNLSKIDIKHKCSGV